MGNTKETLTLAFTTAVGGGSDPKMMNRLEGDPKPNLGFDTLGLRLRAV